MKESYITIYTTTPEGWHILLPLLEKYSVTKKSSLRKLYCRWGELMHSNDPINDLIDLVIIKGYKTESTVEFPVTFHVPISTYAHLKIFKYKLQDQ